MKFKLTFAVASLAAIVMSATGAAQVFNQTAAKAPASSLGWTGGFDLPYDMATDASGNRYVVGYRYDGSDYVGFLLKYTKKGFLVYDQTIDDGDGNYATAVATDNAGHVYVGSNHNSSYAVHQFDAAAGTNNWSKPGVGDGIVYDIAVNNDGDVIAATTTEISPDTYSPAGYRFKGDGSAVFGWYIPGEGALTSVALRNGTDAFFGGYLYDSTEYNGRMLYIRGDFNTAQVATFDTTSSVSEFISKIAIDPVTGTAVGIGSTYSSFLGDGEIIYGAWYVDTAGNATPNSSYVSGFGTGAVAGGLACDNEGNIYLGLNGGTDGSINPYVGVAQFRADVGTPSVLHYHWENYAFTEAPTYSRMSGLFVSPEGPVVIADTNTMSGTSPSYRGFEVYSFDKTSASAIDRKEYGSTGVQSFDQAYDYVIYDTAAFDGTWLTFVQPIAPVYSTGIFTGKYTPGPDNNYKMDEDETLSIGIQKGLLPNDGNNFSLFPLTAQYANNSASAGIQSVSVNANGGFTVVPVPNFNGVAKFNYKVRQNGVVVAVNKVTLQIKAKNDAPVAVNDSFIAAQNSPVINLDVLANDTDIDGVELFLVSKTNNANATIGLTADKKFVTFKPKPGFTGSVVFSYTMKDAKNATSTGTVVVTVS